MTNRKKGRCKFDKQPLKGYIVAECQVEAATSHLRTGEEREEERVGGATLKGVAESGFIWTRGAIKTTPAKSVGRSQAVRMEIAPP